MRVQAFVAFVQWLDNYVQGDEDLFGDLLVLGLGNHLVVGRAYRAADLSPSLKLKSVLGTPFTVNKSG